MTTSPDHALFPCWASFLHGDLAEAHELHSQVGYYITERLQSIWDEYQALLLVINETDPEVIPTAGSVMTNQLSAFQVKELVLRAGQIRRFLEFSGFCVCDIPRRFPTTEMHFVAIVFQVAFSLPFGDSRRKQPCKHHNHLVCSQTPQELRALLANEQSRVEQVSAHIQWALETLALTPATWSVSGGQLLQAAIEMAANIAETSVTSSQATVPGSSADVDPYKRPPSTRPATACSQYDDEIDWLERLVEKKCVIEPRPTQGQQLDGVAGTGTAVARTPREAAQVPASAFGPAATPAMPASEPMTAPARIRPCLPPVPPPPTRRPVPDPSTPAPGRVVVLKSTRSVHRPLPHIVCKTTTPPPALAAVPGVGSGADETSVMRSCVSMP